MQPRENKEEIILFMAIPKDSVTQDGRIEVANTGVKFSPLSSLLLSERGERSATRMMLSMQQLEALTRDVSIDLRCGNISMAQQHLHNS